MTLSRRARRAVVVAAIVAVAGAAAALVLSALRSNVAFFYTPTQVLAGEAPHGRTFRVGGLVKAGSLRRDGATARFVVTDLGRELEVTYTGILPDLFREGRGAVAQGRLGDDGTGFAATEVLAKHDENYMPPEAKAALSAASAAAAGSRP